MTSSVQGSRRGIKTSVGCLSPAVIIHSLQTLTTVERKGKQNKPIPETVISVNRYTVDPQAMASANNGSVGKWEVVKKGKKPNSTGEKKPDKKTGGRKALSESNLPRIDPSGK